MAREKANELEWFRRQVLPRLPDAECHAMTHGGCIAWVSRPEGLLTITQGLDGRWVVDARSTRALNLSRALTEAMSLCKPAKKTTDTDEG